MDVDFGNVDPGTAIFLIFSFTRIKGKQSRLSKWRLAWAGMLGSIFVHCFLFGFDLTVFPPENIAEFVGKQSLLWPLLLLLRSDNYPDSAFIIFRLSVRLCTRAWDSSLRRFSDNAYDGWYRHISA